MHRLTHWASQDAHREEHSPPRWRDVLTSRVTYRIPEDGLQQERVRPGERDQPQEGQQLSGRLEAPGEGELAHLPQVVDLCNVQLARGKG
jgi:hypothetical protein